jgi:trans-aconitate methyltransferase
VADLLEPLPIPPVDAILSSATFHWIRDHDRQFANLRPPFALAGSSPRSAVARATS